MRTAAFIPIIQCIRAETDRQLRLNELVIVQQKFCQYADINIEKSGEDFIGFYVLDKICKEHLGLQ